ncbi:MAG: dTDP-4-amino-4,6-dideoxygalactose transaminase [Herbaspirillum sp.]
MIPFNRPYMTGQELEHIAQAHSNGHLSGDGPYTKRCNAWLEQRTHASKAMLTNSCTAALEMSALLLDLVPGDEVIMPSYTFVSTANAFVLRGAVPVFVDIRPDTLNLDERLIEAAITPNTKAICVVHYAGVACEMDAIMEIASRHNLWVVEDAAQALMSSYQGRPLGTIGDLGAISFHETKNIICGEGGALLCRDSAFAERAEIIREKGTNRSRFFRGQVDKYTWVEMGSSFLPGEISAAFLDAQMTAADDITARRMALWNHYHAWALPHEEAGRLRRPIIPTHCTHNAHMYYLLLPSIEKRTAFINVMKEKGVQTVFHYIPLHSSPAGIRYGRTSGSLQVTDHVANCLVRMPLWIGLESVMDEVTDAANYALRG